MELLVAVIALLLLVLLQLAYASAFASWMISLVVNLSGRLFVISIQCRHCPEGNEKFGLVASFERGVLIIGQFETLCNDHW